MDDTDTDAEVVDDDDTIAEHDHETLDHTIQ